jgi:cell division protein FtsW (lipid II flippase)
MNLFSESDASWFTKVVVFLFVFIPTISLTMYTMVKSKRLSDFLDVVSDERVSAWNKTKAFLAVWSRGSD